VVLRGILDEAEGLKSYVGFIVGRHPGPSRPWRGQVVGKLVARVSEEEGKDVRADEAWRRASVRLDQRTPSAWKRSGSLGMRPPESRYSAK
jgi:hypothetical protein